MNKKNIIVALFCVFAVSELHSGWKHYFGAVFVTAIAVKALENHKRIGARCQAVKEEYQELKEDGKNTFMPCAKSGVTAVATELGSWVQEIDTTLGGYGAAGCSKAKGTYSATKEWYNNCKDDVKEKGWKATCKEQAGHLGTGIKNTDAKFGGYGAQAVKWGKSQLAKFKKSNDEQLGDTDIPATDV